MSDEEYKVLLNSITPVVSSNLDQVMLLLNSITPVVSSNLDQVMFSPNVDRIVPKTPGKRQISLQGGGAREHQMTSQRIYWRDVAIHNGVMTLCFEQLK